MLKKIKQIIKHKIMEKPMLEELISKGLIVGKNFDMEQECIIDYSHCHRIKIGDNVTLAPRVHILAHDASPNKFIGVVKEGEVVIGNNVFIGANTTILCDTIIGDNVIIGANSLVCHDVPNNVVIAGNPAKIICSIQEYLDKIENETNCRITYLKIKNVRRVI